jgi:hypothetical protein
MYCHDCHDFQTRFALVGHLHLRLLLACQMVAVVADPMVASDSQGSIYPFSVIGMPLRSSPRAQAASIVLRAAGVPRMGDTPIRKHSED